MIDAPFPSDWFQPAPVPTDPVGLLFYWIDRRINDATSPAELESLRDMLRQDADHIGLRRVDRIRLQRSIEKINSMINPQHQPHQ